MTTITKPTMLYLIVISARTLLLATTASTIILTTIFTVMLMVDEITKLQFYALMTGALGTVAVHWLFYGAIRLCLWLRKKQLESDGDSEI